MDDIEALGQVFIAIWSVWATPVNLPLIGQTSFFVITIALAGFGILCGFIARMLGGSDDG